jgi:hypothetical protein
MLAFAPDVISTEEIKMISIKKKSPKLKVDETILTDGGHCITALETKKAPAEIKFYFKLTLPCDIKEVGGLVNRSEHMGSFYAKNI